MSEVMYCNDCDAQQTNAAKTNRNISTTANIGTAAVIIDSPACLATVAPLGAQRKTVTTLLNVHSELEMLGGSQAKNALINATADRENNTRETSVGSIVPSNLPAATDAAAVAANDSGELEFGDDVSAGMCDSVCNDGAVADIGGVLTAAKGDTENRDHIADQSVDATAAGAAVPASVGPAATLAATTIRVHGTEELPANVQATNHACALRLRSSRTGREPKTGDSSGGGVEVDSATNDNGNNGNAGDGLRRFSTLPKVRRANSVATSNPVNGSGGASGGYRRKVPMRTTPDGTNIYYWCDLSKRAQKGAIAGRVNGGRVSLIYFNLFCYCCVYL